MNIYHNTEIEELNNIDLYSEGIEATENALKISRKINESIDEKYNIFVYWIGSNVNYKHSVVLKSFLATQNLKNATLKIYSDMDISKNPIFDRYKNFKEIEFNIFNIEEEIKGTVYENFKYIQEIKNHNFNPAYESDFFRLLILHKYGGFYIDFDILLLRDLSPLLKYDFFYQWGSTTKSINMLNGAIMHLKKDSNANNLATQYILNSYARPGAGSLQWASDLYLQIKNQCPNVVIFPAAFFNSEWQHNQHTVDEDGFVKHKFSENIFDGAFSWHWHNRWDKNIEEESKFDILDKILEKKFIEKFEIK